MEGKRVLVVDDGLATAATVTAALRQLRAAGADSVVLAVPVGSPDAVERLLGEADDVIADETPPHFEAVGQFYESFPQLSDAEARSYLDDWLDD